MCCGVGELPGVERRNDPAPDLPNGLLLVDRLGRRRNLVDRPAAGVEFSDPRRRLDAGRRHAGEAPEGSDQRSRQAAGDAHGATSSGTPPTSPSTMRFRTRSVSPGFDGSIQRTPDSFRNHVSCRLA